MAGKFKQHVYTGINPGLPTFRAVSTRLPNGIHQKMMELAERNRRSFNAELQVAVEFYISKQS